MTRHRRPCSVIAPGGILILHMAIRIGPQRRRREARTMGIMSGRRFMQGHTQNHKRMEGARTHMHMTRAYTHTLSLSAYMHTLLLNAYTHTLSLNAYMHTLSLNAYTPTLSLNAYVHAHTITQCLHAHTINQCIHAHHITQCKHAHTITQCTWRAHTRTHYHLMHTHHIHVFFVRIASQRQTGATPYRRAGSKWWESARKRAVGSHQARSS